MESNIKLFLLKDEKEIVEMLEPIMRYSNDFIMDADKVGRLLKNACISHGKETESFLKSIHNNEDMLKENEQLKEDMKEICDKLIEFGQKNSDLIIENNRLKNENKQFESISNGFLRLVNKKEKEMVNLENNIRDLKSELSFIINNRCELRECDNILTKCKQKNACLIEENGCLLTKLKEKDNKINVLMEEKKELLEKIDLLTEECFQNSDLTIHYKEIAEDLEDLVEVQEEEIERLEDGLIKNYLNLKLHKSMLNSQGISFDDAKVEGNIFSIDINIDENIDIEGAIESLNNAIKLLM